MVLSRLLLRPNQRRTLAFFDAGLVVRALAEYVGLLETYDALDVPPAISLDLPKQHQAAQILEALCSVLDMSIPGNLNARLLKVDWCAPLLGRFRL